MRKGKISRSALNVAYLRALGTLNPIVPSFSDPYAEFFLPPRFAKNLANTRKKNEKHPASSQFLFWGRGMGIFYQFRTVILDRAIQDALPVTQLVILGAGLDSRAWRLTGLENTTVFEIDHPDTQKWKKEIASHFPLLAREICFAAVDFKVDDLVTQITEAGYNSDRQALWLMEGVSPYLPRAILAQTLATIASLAPRGSRIAMSYMSKKNGQVPRSLYLKLTGEPIITGFTPGELAIFAADVNWVTFTDTGIEDWKKILTPTLKLTAKDVGVQWFERIWLGTRQ